MRHVLVSVLTATYDRAATLPDVFAGLVEQTAELEWIVVDDGSTDHTVDVVTALASRAPFPVRLLTQPNRGKHAALNRGVRHARGELVLIVDSDDRLLPDAVTRLLARWRDIPEDRRAAYCGVWARCVERDGGLIGDGFPGPTPVDCGWHEFVYAHRARGDRCGVLRTDLLRAHPFPEPPDRRYVAEGTVWRRIGTTYLTRHVNDPVLLVRTDNQDRLTLRSWADARIAAGTHDQNADVLCLDLRWFRHAPRSFVRSAMYYTRSGLCQGVPLRRQAARLPPPARALWAATLPMSTAAWLLRDRGRLSRAAWPAP